MRKSIKTMGAMALALIMAASVLPVQNVNAQGNTSIKGMKELKKDKQYQYDLDGDGDKESIYWALTEESEENSVLALYVNSENIFR